jgi:fluoride ion exporter CrcB/FEX
MKYLAFLAFGALGGLARGLVGALKSFRPVGNSRTLDWKQLGLNIIGSTVIGGVVGLIIDINPITAVTSGYMGIDVIESVIKLSKK